MLWFHMPQSLLQKRPIADIAHLNNVEEIIDWMFDDCKEIGANKMSYHFYSEISDENIRNGSVISKGYPDTWVLRYASGDLGNSDPTYLRMKGAS